MVLRYGSLALKQRDEMWPIFRESSPYLASTELDFTALWLKLDSEILWSRTVDQ
jgi:hypothetical protein